MKFLHAADLHLGVARYGTADSRSRDIEETLSRMIVDARENAVAYTVLSGDIFESRRPGPDALHVFTEFVEAAGRLIIVPGNHDGMTTVGDPSTHALLWLQSLNLRGVHVLTEPGIHRIGWDEAGDAIDVFALPYPHKRALDRELGDAPVDERATIVGARVESAIRELAIRPDPDVPFIFVGHVSTVGAALGSESAMKLGWDAAIGADVLDPFDYAALGHIHRQQQVGPRAWYAGSTEYLDFKDVNSPKGWLLVDTDPLTVVQQRNPTRAMIDITVEQEPDGAFEFTVHGSDAWRSEPIVRLTIHATHARPSPSLIADAIRSLKGAGASYVKTVVKLDLPVAEAEQEVDPEADTETLLAGWLTERGHPLEPTMSVGQRLLAGIDAAT